ncbi:hypothetical protein, partial [Pseudomonas syringae]|uniref:hypothetical protein n=1 Tax=Pseudomonas syringae TaxID=317 RepID=UPI0034E84914
SVKRLFQEVFKVSFATSTTCAAINSGVAHQREANSTALQPRVKLFFSHRCRSIQTRPTSSLTLHSKTLQTIDLQGFFVFRLRRK